ncbi:MAG: PhzF family phenazine biosynthesis protein [Acidiphilium sp.]
MNTYAFHQVDVFAETPLTGNPLAVVVGADALSDATMAAFANWTNLSETTFLLAPTEAGADYRVRIFTPERELPFAGHPTLGTAHVWLARGGAPKGEHIVQQCATGLIRIRRDGDRLAFAAPPLHRSGPVDADDLARIAHGIGIGAAAIAASQWVDNGPGWVAVMLRDRDAVLALRPDWAALRGYELGVVAPWDAAKDGDAARFEVRAFIPDRGAEDPVTGSLNAGIAQWLIGAGLAPETYVARQGTALGRAGCVHVAKIGADIWVGGRVIGCVEGMLRL